MYFFSLCFFHCIFTFAFLYLSSFFFEFGSLPHSLQNIHSGTGSGHASYRSASLSNLQVILSVGDMVFFTHCYLTQWFFLCDWVKVCYSWLELLKIAWFWLFIVAIIKIAMLYRMLNNILFLKVLFLTLWTLSRDWLKCKIYEKCNWTLIVWIPVVMDFKTLKYIAINFTFGMSISLSTWIHDSSLSWKW